MYIWHLHSFFVINHSAFADYLLRLKSFLIISKHGIVALYIVLMSAKFQLFTMHHVGLVRFPVKIVEF